jgi:hypothetical protein
MEWNPLVNTNFSLEGDYGLQEGFLEELQFGAEKTLLKNSHIPTEYPSLNLVLDNKNILGALGGKTEFEEFENWFNNTLRYGTLPFYATLGRAKGIYKFIPNSVKYDRIQGMVLVSFGLEEIYI